MLADAFMIFHLLWVLFMILGLPLGLWLRSPTLRWVHFGGMAITTFFAATGTYCPLTVLEETLRWKSNPGFSYGGSFLVRFLSPILYPQIQPWVIRMASVVWGMLTLLCLFLKRPGPLSRKIDRS